MNPELEIASLGLTVKRKDAAANGPTARLDCPFCQGEESLGVLLTTGVWTCHKCSEKGNLFQLRRKLRGDAPRLIRPGPRRVAPAGRQIEAEKVEASHLKLLKDDSEAWMYAAGKRAFSEEIVRKFKLGVHTLKKGKALVIPYFQSGKCLGVKYRLLPPNDTERKYEREPGCVLPLFNVDSLAGESKAVAITEGELDAIAWTQYETGIPAVSIPNGATAQLSDQDADALVHFDEVLLVFDGDEKGEEGAEKLAERLGAFRCRRVRLPFKDVNECLVNGVTKDVLLDCIQKSSVYYQSSVKSISEWGEELIAGERPGMKSKLTGWKSLDKLLGGLRPGEVTLLTAETGAGKTTWSLDLARRQAMNGHAVMVASLELPPVVVARKLLSSVAGQRWDTLQGEALTNAVNSLSGYPLFLLDRYGSLDFQRLREETEFAVRRHGVSLVVVDHLHFMLGIKKAHDDERALIDQTSLAIQNMAMDFGVHVLLVMHPAKIRAERGKTREPDIGDLKGSSGPGQYADNVARLSRRDNDRAILSLLKVRSELGRMGQVTFAFDPEKLQFADVDSSDKKKKPDAPAHWTEEREPGDEPEEGKEETYG